MPFMRFFSYLFIASMISFSCFAQEHTSAMTSEHKQWLRDKFSVQHQNIIPKVAVADMFYGCNLVRKTDPTHIPLAMLITKIDKNTLAEKLTSCLGEENIQSEDALNYGLVGCYTDQFSTLPEQEKDQKMQLVHRAIKKLSREERQKSFTKCVTEQAIKYLN